MFEDLFPSGRGRPSVPPDVVATVIVLQTLHGLSDREAAEAVMFDLRWKAACGLAVTAASFHPSTLTYWRRRLAASARPQRIFEAVAAVVAQTGAVRGKTRRALDSTVLDDAVARQDTVTQLIAAIRRVAREVPGAQDLVGAHCTGHDYSRPGKPQIAWDDEQARELLVSALVNDALVLLDRLDTESLTAAAAEAVALLALVAGQDVEPAEGSDGTDGRWRIARKVAPDRMISTVDPETRHAHKTRHRRQDGFRAHVVVEPDTGLITGSRLTKVSGPENSDATVGITLLAADTSIDTSCSQPSGEQAGEPGVEVLADSAYGTGDALAAIDAAGHTAIIKPWPLRPAVEGGFTLDDFTVDEAAGTVTCPNGLTRTITVKRAVVFGVRLRELPTAATMHDLGYRPDDQDSPALWAAAHAPGQSGRPGLPGHLPTAPSDGRTLPGLADPRQPASAVPRDRQERLLADPPGRRDQPAQAPSPGTAARTHRMGPGPRLTRPTSGLDHACTQGHHRLSGQVDLDVQPQGCDLHAARRPSDGGLPAQTSLTTAHRPPSSAVS